MKITDILNRKSVALNVQANSKSDIIDKMTRLMEASGNLSNTEQYKSGVLEREKEGTTGIGNGIAIPHAKSVAVKQAGLAAMVLKN